MSLKSTSTANDKRGSNGMLILLACLVGITLFLFKDSFKSGLVIFSNDGPLGQLKTESLKMPGAFSGIWTDVNWLGASGGYATIGPTYLLLWILGPVGFAKLYVPAALLILGLSAGYFFKRLGFNPTVCVLGGLAAALNSNFFSNACWGLASRALSLAAIFLSLTALQSGWATQSALRRIVLTVLAGAGIGMSIIEGGDNGAIFSLFVGAFAFYQCLFLEGPWLLRLIKGACRVAVMIVFSAMLAAQTLNVFVNTSVKGIVGIETNEMTPEQKWSWATQWSLPPAETLRAVVPGLFGYRMDTLGGGNYWGGVGRDLAYDQTKQGMARHSGAGEYAGVLVVLVALWSLMNAFGKQESAFTPDEKKMIWFWGASAVVALVISWGHHAPFYQLVFKLPFFSTIRNPMKFMHPFHLCVLILFGYGLQGIWRRYLEPATVKAQAFEKKWLRGSLAALGLSVLALLIYAMSGNALVKHLMDVGFNDESFARQMAQFSVNEVKYSVFFLMVSVIGLILIQRGVFSGPKARWAGVLLGIILVIDLARANAFWIKYDNYQEKYSPNPVLDTLRAKPFEGRAAMALFMGVTQAEFEALQRVFSFTRAWSGMQQIYGGDWLQHQFPYYNIQSLDMPQEPRMPAEKKAYRDALNGRLTRLYELTNTRFLLGMGGNFAEALNQIFDPQKRRFRLHTGFEFVQTGPENFAVQPNPAGQFGLIEFTGALPRTKLYANWEVNTNSAAVLARLADPSFDPTQNVIVSDVIPAPPAAATTTPSLSAEITSYAPKRIEVKTSAPMPSVLLMNNRFDEGWVVTVDGQPANLLRCNFLMQGVSLPANTKSVVFRYAPKSTIFFVSFGAVLLGVALCGYLVVVREKSQPAPAPAPSAPASPKAKSSGRKS